MPKPLKFALAAAVLLVLGLGAQSTVASWRAQNVVEPGSVKTGSLALFANGESAHQFTALGNDGLIPGEFTQASLALSNAGTADMAYQLEGAVNAAASPSAADRTLAEAVQLQINTGMSATDCTNKQPLSGTQLYSGPLSSNASFSAPRNLVARGEQSSELLCVRVTLPSGASQAASGGDIELELRFAGEQR